MHFSYTILLLQLQQAPRLPDLRRPAPDRRLRQRVRRAQRVRRRPALLVSPHIPLLYPPTQGEIERESLGGGHTNLTPPPIKSFTG